MNYFNLHDSQQVLKGFLQQKYIKRELTPLAAQAGHRESR